jgi:monovalent cation:H+ antiporter-2, CPA2 family
LASPLALSVMAAVAVLSIIFSSITIAYSKPLYKIVSPMLTFFERKSGFHFMERKVDEILENHVVIIGAHHLGSPVVKFLQTEKVPFIVMDFNPHIVQKMRDDGVNVIYGDLGDPEILDSLQLEKSKLIISTARDMSDNELLLEECKRRKIRAKVVARAVDKDHAAALKKLGADYIILPEQVSGDFLVSQLKTHWPEIHFSGMS